MVKQDLRMIAAANKKALLKARREFAKLRAEMRAYYPAKPKARH